MDKNNMKNIIYVYNKTINIAVKKQWFLESRFRKNKKIVENIIDIIKYCRKYFNNIKKKLPNINDKNHKKFFWIIFQILKDRKI